jgi:hypothetical protein
MHFIVHDHHYAQTRRSTARRNDGPQQVCWPISAGFHSTTHSAGYGYRYICGTHEFECEGGLLNRVGALRNDDALRTLQNDLLDNLNEIRDVRES